MGLVEMLVIVYAEAFKIDVIGSFIMWLTSHWPIMFCIMVSPLILKSLGVIKEKMYKLLMITNIEKTKRTVSYFVIYRIWFLKILTLHIEQFLTWINHCLPSNHLIIPSPTKLRWDIVMLPFVLPSVRPSVTSLLTL
jgi:hypothetical protein